MRCSNTKYPFDGHKERMVDDGKHIILVFIVFDLLVSNDFGISQFSIPCFWIYTVFDIFQLWYSLFLALHISLYIVLGNPPILAFFIFLCTMILAIHRFWHFSFFGVH